MVQAAHTLSHATSASSPVSAQPVAAALQALTRSVEAFVALKSAPVDRGTYHRVARGIHTLIADVERVEAQGVERAHILEVIRPARELQGMSPFVRRLQTWPRGYRGDFETVEYICDQVNRAVPGTLAFEIERFALAAPPAQQHRNKLQHQAQKILRMLQQCNQPPQILSLACSGSQDLRGIQSLLRGAREVVLNDVSEDALEKSRKHLKEIEGKLQFVPGNPLRAVGRLRQLGPYDLIVAGGLFDYLPDRYALFLLQHLHTLLKPRGQVFFTNIAIGNRYRVWLEYFADWPVYERTEEMLQTLLATAGFDPSKILITREETNLTFLVTAERASGSRQVEQG